MKKRENALRKLRSLPAFPGSLLAATSLPDAVEQAEDAAERRYEEQTDGLPEGKFRCGCGRIDDIEHAMPASASPWAEPICRECVEECKRKAFP